MKRVAILFALTTLLALAGCFEETNTYYVNPDGSGKVIHEVITVADDLNLSGGAASPDPQSLLKKTARKILYQSKGIDTWSDIKTSVTDKGKLHFKGTAYFPDIRNVSFADKDNVETSTHLEISLTPDGLLTVAMREDTDDEETSEAVDYTPEQLQQQLQQQRIKYSQMKPIMIQLLDSLRKQDTFHYAGTLVESVNFQAAENSVSITLEGRKLLAYMDTLMADDARMLELIKQGKNMEEGFSDPDMYAFFWGKPELPAAEIKLTQPVFDYAQEVAAAKSKYDEMLTALDLTAWPQSVVTATETPVQGTELQSLRVGGVRLVYFEDDAIGYRPLNNFPGFRMSLIGRLPQSGLQVKDGTLTKAVTLGGKSLLPNQAFKRSLDSVKIADDGISATFEVELEVPAENETGFEEIAGTLFCFKSENEKIVDLGLMELKTGSRNETENISISRVSKSWSNENQIEFKLELPEHVFKDIRIFTEDGRRIETRLYSSSTSNGNLMQQGIATEEQLPEKACVEFVLYDNIQEYEIPFSLKNISLLGKPLNQ